MVAVVHLDFLKLALVATTVSLLVLEVVKLPGRLAVLLEVLLHGRLVVLPEALRPGNLVAPLVALLLGTLVVVDLTIVMEVIVLGVVVAAAEAMEVAVTVTTMAVVATIKEDLAVVPLPGLNKTPTAVADMVATEVGMVAEGTVVALVSMIRVEDMAMVKELVELPGTKVVLVAMVAATMLLLHHPHLTFLHHLQAMLLLLHLHQECEVVTEQLGHIR